MHDKHWFLSQRIFCFFFDRNKRQLTLSRIFQFRFAFCHVQAILEDLSTIWNANDEIVHCAIVQTTFSKI